MMDNGFYTCYIQRGRGRKSKPAVETPKFLHHNSEGVEQGLGLHLALADVVHALEQRVPFKSVACLEEVEDLLRSDDALESLAIQQFLLELFKRLFRRPHERLCTFAITTTEGSLERRRRRQFQSLGEKGSAKCGTRRSSEVRENRRCTLLKPSGVTYRDQVGDAGRVVREGLRRRRRKEFQRECLHLQETRSDDGRLGVAAHVESIDKAGSEGDDVLEGARERDAGDVGDAVDAEHLGREDGLPEGAVLGRRAPDRRLAELFVGDLESNVGAAESRAREAELALDDGRVGVDVVRLEVDFDTLDGRDGARALGQDARLGELLDDRRQELVRDAEDDESRALRKRE